MTINFFFFIIYLNKKKKKTFFTAYTDDSFKSRRLHRYLTNYTIVIKRFPTLLPPCQSILLLVRVAMREREEVKRDFMHKRLAPFFIRHNEDDIRAPNLLRSLILSRPSTPVSRTEAQDVRVSLEPKTLAVGGYTSIELRKLRVYFHRNNATSVND